jgi:hypothetical protein
MPAGLLASAVHFRSRGVPTSPPMVDLGGCGAVELSVRRFDGVGGEVGGAVLVAEPGVAVG